jgi:SAM-dependent methyltransferase
MNFTKYYAECYESIHNTKDYTNEMVNLKKFLENELISKDLNCALDFGCGTGLHTNLLRSDNLRVDGYDVNENMLKIAQNRYPNIKFSSKLSELNSPYDLVYSLFDVISYQSSEEAMNLYFEQITSIMTQNGIFIADGWHLPGVQRFPPQERRTTFEFQGRLIDRLVVPTTSNNFRVTNLGISLIDSNTNEIILFEDHSMVALDSSFLTSMCLRYGLKILLLKDGSNWQNKLEQNSWRFFMVAEKVNL